MWGVNNFREPDIMNESLRGTVDILHVKQYDACEIYDNDDLRWYLVAIVGTTLSIISLITNLLIAWTLLTERRNHFFFLGFLSVSDIFLSACYGPVIAMDVIKNRLRMIWLNKLWWFYVGPLLAMCHTSMTFSCFLIILATVERFLIIQKSRFLRDLHRNRGKLIILMFLFATAIRATVYFELELMHNTNCSGLTEYEPILTPLVSTLLYGTVFRFYFRNIFTVFMPFFLLAYLNFRIVHTLRKKDWDIDGSNERKAQIRSATMLTVLIVCSYLMANALNVLITAWEYIDFDSAQTEKGFQVYEICTDVISVLYIFTCATRLLVYMISNREIRLAILQKLHLRPMNSVKGSSCLKCG